MFYFWYVIWNRVDLSILVRLLVMISATFFYVLLVVTVLMYLFIILIWIVMFAFCCFVCFIRFQKCDRLLANISHCLEDRRMNTGKMIRFLHIHQATTSFMFSFNKLIDQTLILYILTNIPYNTTIIVEMIVHPDRNILFYVPQYVFLLQQLFVMIITHLFGTLFTRQLHSPIKHLMSVHTRTMIRSRRKHLKIANYIHALHTKNRYGMTYGPIGLITIMSFTKFIFMYVRFLMFNYKNLTK